MNLMIMLMYNPYLLKNRQNNENLKCPSYLLIIIGSCELQNKEQNNDLYICTHIQFIQNFKIHTNENATCVLTFLLFPFYACLCPVYTLQTTKYL